MRHLQCYLREWGMYSWGPLTGTFDAKTERAVRVYKFYKYQRHTDAIVGPGTWANILLTSMTRLSGLILYVPSTSGCTEALHYPVTQGDRGASVRLLQCALNRWYDMIGSRTRIGVDGVFGSQTATAVKEFKRWEFGSAPDAIVGPGAWERLLWTCPCGGA